MEITISNYQRELNLLVKKCKALKYPVDKKDILGLHSLALAGESGEIANKVKKVIWYGKEIDKNDLCDELGDVLWHLSEMATLLDTSLDEIAEKSINKTKKRNGIK